MLGIILRKLGRFKTLKVALLLSLGILFIGIGLQLL